MSKITVSLIELRKRMAQVWGLLQLKGKQYIRQIEIPPQKSKTERIPFHNFGALKTNKWNNNNLEHERQI